MTTRGRPTAPLEKAVARGTEGAEARAAMAPRRIEGVPNPPGWFDADALDCWIRVSQLLFARGQLSLESEPSLIALCQCYSDWVNLAKKIRTMGMTQTVFNGESSKEAARPEVAIFADVDRRFKGWLNEFGLTDASRGKVVGSPPIPSDGNDPLSAYGLQ